MTDKLKLFNTETRKKETIAAQPGQKIRMYTCGPTIYNFAHIGNFRTYVFEDLLRRTIQFFGFAIEQAMNLTDVDDKTISGAIAKGVALHAFTEPYRLAFFADLKALNIEPVEHYPAATDYIPEMIRLIEQLLQKQIAYVGPSGSIYYSIAKFPTYGRLSHLCLDDLKINASGDNQADEYEKDNLSDFVLWKAYDPLRDGTIFWQSPFGPGRPGWHIECSAMAMKILGPTIDIHCGGVDNMFPHHENEIAQSEGCSGHTFVRHWIHVEHLLVDHKKMSKSLGNFYTLRDLFARGYTGSEIRYVLLSTHYRMQLNFTFTSLDAARASLQRLSDCIARLREVSSGVDTLQQLRAQAAAEFEAALADDINISAALAVLFDFVREVNSAIDQERLGVEGAKRSLALLEKWDSVLGLIPFHSEEIPEELNRLLKQREEARASKNYKLSDQMRDEILKRGYVIEDTPSGVRLKRKG